MGELAVWPLRWRYRRDAALYLKQNPLPTVKTVTTVETVEHQQHPQATVTTTVEKTEIAPEAKP